MSHRLVLDTNILLSRLLLPGSIPAKAVGKAALEGKLLASIQTLDELTDVLSREKFDRYFRLAERQEFVRWYVDTIEMVPATGTLRACRDPKDDKFLELAVNGRADFVITGDNDLLTLDPFRGVRIVRPAGY